MDNTEFRIDKVNSEIEIYQRKDGFSYGTDAVLLAAYIRKGKGKAVEFGAGTGIVSLLCEKRNKFEKVYSVEVQKEYFDILEKNIEINNSRITPIFKDLRNVDISDFSCEVDCVFTNPPYMKTDSGKMNINGGKNIARHEVKGDISDFCRVGSEILKTGGSFYVVYRPDRLSDLMRALSDNKLEVKRMTFVHSRTDSRACMVLIEAKKGAKCGMLLTKPLIIYKDNSEEYSADMQKIYSEGDFDDEFKRVCYRKK